MRIGRIFTIAALLLLVVLGAALVFDQRLVSIRRESALAAYIYAPTAFFAVIGMIQFHRGRYWPAVAFTVGLIVTGLFHQNVIGMYHGNPGYMFPGGHIAAPIVSVVAYSISFLGAWVIARTSRRLRLQSASDAGLENRK